MISSREVTAHRVARVAVDCIFRPVGGRLRDLVPSAGRPCQGVIPTVVAAAIFACLIVIQHKLNCALQSLNRGGPTRRTDMDNKRRNRINTAIAQVTLAVGTSGVAGLVTS